jgi:hypothetical protein
LTRKANAMPAGGGGGGWAKMNEDMAANRAKRQARTFGTNAVVGNGGMCDQVAPRSNLTWVGGNRNVEDLDETSQKILAATVTGTSIFDPVLCELAYRWFCPPGGLVLDPFAGGSVRGIVAAKCGRRYTGIDLSERQCAANQGQAEAICAGGEMPIWACGDAADLGKLETGAADFVFSCPPYGDLEVYSDNPADLSTMPHAAFMAAYWKINRRVDRQAEEGPFCLLRGRRLSRQGGFLSELSGRDGCGVRGGRRRAL